MTKLKHNQTDMTIFHFKKLHSRPGANPGGGGSWGSGFPPNFIKRKKTSHACAGKQCILVLNSSLDPPFPKSCIRPCRQSSSGLLALRAISILFHLFPCFPSQVPIVSFSSGKINKAHASTSSRCTSHPYLSRVDQWLTRYTNSLSEGVRSAPRAWTGPSMW